MLGQMPSSNHVDAPGTVGEVRVTEGDVVQEGDVLVVLV